MTQPVKLTWMSFLLALHHHTSNNSPMYKSYLASCNCNLWIHKVNWCWAHMNTKKRSRVVHTHLHWTIHCQHLWRHTSCVWSFPEIKIMHSQALKKKLKLKIIWNINTNRKWSKSKAFFFFFYNGKQKFRDSRGYSIPGPGHIEGS